MLIKTEGSGSVGNQKQQDELIIRTFLEAARRPDRSKESKGEPAEAAGHVGPRSPTRQQRKVGASR
ncbi:hypothetical protein MUK42_32550 [Musa troglodytarum]|uniref:Uncharacterized protein n=1 Tax=Musa troglodytarum TaxID=320322 RepID=A0A9E7G9G0_9LILI|nr:hypothetical protein MUK42_32550 [Musa troglodytarum]